VNLFPKSESVYYSLIYSAIPNCD